MIIWIARRFLCVTGYKFDRNFEPYIWCCMRHRTYLYFHRENSPAHPPTRPVARPPVGRCSARHHRHQRLAANISSIPIPDTDIVLTLVLRHRNLHSEHIGLARRAGEGNVSTSMHSIPVLLLADICTSKNILSLNFNTSLCQDGQ